MRRGPRFGWPHDVLRHFERRRRAVIHSEPTYPNENDCGHPGGVESSRPDGLVDFAAARRARRPFEPRRRVPRAGKRPFRPYQRPSGRRTGTSWRRFAGFARFVVSARTRGSRTLCSR